MSESVNNRRVIVGDILVDEILVDERPDLNVDFFIARFHFRPCSLSRIMARLKLTMKTTLEIII